MWEFLGSLVRAFLMLRDIFGYLVPGTVMLGSIVYVYEFDWAKDSWPDGSPGWLAVAAAIVACYVVGQILVAIGYSIHSIGKTVLKLKSWKGASPADLA